MTVYPTRKSTCLVLFGIGSFLVFLPVGLGTLTAFTNPEVIGAFFVIGLITVPPGLMLCSMGVGCKRLRLEIDPDAGLLRARLPRRNLFLFPWQVKPVSIPFSSVDRVDVKWRANPYMAGGLEGLYFIRTKGGDLHFHSKWFPDHEEIATRITELAGVDSTAENLDLPPVFLPGQAPPKLLASEIAMRGCGYTLLVVSVVLAVCLPIAIFFAEPEDRGDTIKALFFLLIGIPASRMLIRYRKAH